jgi:hypothetical protein
MITLPYTFHCFDTHTAPIRSKSTSSKKKDYWLYDHVCSLHYDFSLSSGSALSYACFSNICHLSLELPTSDNIWSALSTFVHLNSLDVFVLNDNVKVQNQLQILLDRAPNLYSLRLSCEKLSAPELSLLTNSSISVRHLNLHGYIVHTNWHCFNNQ